MFIHIIFLSYVRDELNIIIYRLKDLGDLLVLTFTDLYEFFFKHLNLVLYWRLGRSNVDECKGVVSNLNFFQLLNIGFTCFKINGRMKERAIYDIILLLNYYNN